MSTEAMKQALEALEWHTQGKAYIPLKSQSAITALRQAIERAQKQEPVGEVGQIDIDEDGIGFAWFTIDSDGLKIGDKLYTSPPPRQWVGLTEEERNNLEDYCEMIIGKAAFDAIEAKLKEKQNGN